MATAKSLHVGLGAGQPPQPTDTSTGKITALATAKGQTIKVNAKAVAKKSGTKKSSKAWARSWHS